MTAGEEQRVDSQTASSGAWRIAGEEQRVGSQQARSGASAWLATPSPPSALDRSALTQPGEAARGIPLPMSSSAPIPRLCCRFLSSLCAESAGCLASNASAPPTSPPSSSGALNPRPTPRPLRRGSGPRLASLRCGSSLRVASLRRGVAPGLPRLHTLHRNRHPNTTGAATEPRNKGEGEKLMGR